MATSIMILIDDMMKTNELYFYHGTNGVPEFDYLDDNMIKTNESYFYDDTNDAA